MKHPKRLSTLFLIGMLAAGSSALGYYYYFVYEPPLATAEAFMAAMESRDTETLKRLVVVTPDREAEATQLRPPKDEELKTLIREDFHRGRILDQDKREGGTGDIYFLIYREPDGLIYALMITRMGKDYKVVIPERPRFPMTPYLVEYMWTN